MLNEPHEIRIFDPSQRPDWVPRPQVILKIGVVFDRPGGCEITFKEVPNSKLVAKYGSAIATIKACRDIIIGEIDHLIASFEYEES